MWLGHCCFRYRERAARTWGGHSLQCGRRHGPVFLCCGYSKARTGIAQAFLQHRLRPVTWAEVRAQWEGVVLARRGADPSLVQGCGRCRLSWVAGGGGGAGVSLPAEPCAVGTQLWRCCRSPSSVQVCSPDSSPHCFVFFMILFLLNLARVDFLVLKTPDRHARMAASSGTFCGHGNVLVSAIQHGSPSLVVWLWDTWKAASVAMGLKFELHLILFFLF